jgi:hypothetical protein
MFMGQCQQGCAVGERLKDHHGSRYHDQHKADGKASSASCSALGCSLAHVGRLLQRSPREPSGSTPGGIRQGASVKVVQKTLGHKSAVMTLDRYVFGRGQSGWVVAPVWPRRGPALAPLSAARKRGRTR